MSGVFGLFDPTNTENLEGLLSQMGQVMCHRSWYHVDQFCDKTRHVGLGRVGIGIFNTSQQPIVDETNNLVLFMAGEFYRYKQLYLELVKKGCFFRNESIEELALRLYQYYGIEFVNHVDGIFSIALLDRANEKIYVFNDRFGLKPVYFFHKQDRFIFASELKAFILNPVIPRKLNMTAVAEYIRFQQVLGGKTFFKDIELLSPSTILCYNLKTNSLERYKYWRWEKIKPINHSLTSADVVEETTRLIQQAVNKRMENGERLGLYLTGGLDSRVILSTINPKDHPITTITYGHYRCRDVNLAQRIAKIVGANHQFFDFRNGNWIKDIADLHLDLVEGGHSWVHAHGMSILPKVRDLIDVNLSGVAGGLIMRGAFEKPNIVHASDEEAFLIGMYNLYTQKHSWPGLDEVEAVSLYSSAYRNKYQNLAIESLRLELKKFNHIHNSLRSLFFNLNNHSRRFNYNFVLFHNSHFENRCPFFDYDFINWMASLPYQYRQGDQLQKAVISVNNPLLSLVPYDKQLELATNNKLLNFFYRFYRTISKKMYETITPWHYMPTLYADYENYLRHELRQWAEDILFDERTLARGIFNPNALRSLVDRHMSGHEEWTIGKIAHLITLEMMLRRLFDDDYISTHTDNGYKK